MPRTAALARIARLGVASALASGTAWADPPAPFSMQSPESVEEELVQDGDLDEEDRSALRIGGHTSTADLHGESWLSVVGFERRLANGKNDVGAGLVLALALDRVAQGPVHAAGDVARPAQAGPSAANTVAAIFPPSLARDCVVAAWRTAGLGVDDASIDSVASRSRASAILPEMRLRAMRLFTDATHTTLLATTDTTNYYDAVGANLVLEARMTWRLDRLVYAGDEPTLERVRLQRQDARSRVGQRTLEALFAWERATLDERDVAPGSREQVAASLRTAQAAATLDVLTGGWFSVREAAP